jgi:hypothetical protein
MEAFATWTALRSEAWLLKHSTAQAAFPSAAKIEGRSSTSAGHWKLGIFKKWASSKTARRQRPQYHSWFEHTWHKD